MTESSLSRCSSLYNELKAIPRPQWHRFCRENGEQSKFNAKSSPDYQPYTLNSKM